MFSISPFASFRAAILESIENKMSVVCGLHAFLSDDSEFAKAAQENGVELIDVRKPRSRTELKFWSGDIFSVQAARIAVLGTSAPLQRRGRKAATAVRARTSEPIGRIGPCAE